MGGGEADRWGGKGGGAGVVLVAADGEADDAKEEEEFPLERVELTKLQARDLCPATTRMVRKLGKRRRVCEDNASE